MELKCVCVCYSIWILCVCVLFALLNQNATHPNTKMSDLVFGIVSTTAQHLPFDRSICVCV